MNIKPDLVITNQDQDIIVTQIKNLDHVGDNKSNIGRDSEIPSLVQHLEQLIHMLLQSNQNEQIGLLTDGRIFKFFKIKSNEYSFSYEKVLEFDDQYDFEEIPMDEHNYKLFEKFADLEQQEALYKVKYQQNKSLITKNLTDIFKLVDQQELLQFQ